jgi:hypothetical protein
MGVGKGLVGVVAKPISGFFDMASSTVSGVAVAMDGYADADG